MWLNFVELFNLLGESSYISLYRLCLLIYHTFDFISQQLRIGFKQRSVNVNEFFNPDQIVDNIAALLGIDRSRIRFMQFVSASGGGSRKRRNTEDQDQSYLIVNIFLLSNQIL